MRCSLNAVIEALESVISLILDNIIKYDLTDLTCQVVIGAIADFIERIGHDVLLNSVGLHSVSHGVL